MIFSSDSQIMDVAANEEHEQLRTHSSGINPKIIESLLLPSQFYLRIAMKLQIYFEDRNARASYPGLLGEARISPSSFSVRFAGSNSEMQRVRLAILAMAESRKEEKRIEWQKARAHVRDMRYRVSIMEHEYDEDKWGDSHHRKRCEKCSLQKQIDNYKVAIYERPLKPEIYHQHAVVFELLLPTKIECLRDVLHLFVSKHYNSSLMSLKMHGKWTAYEQIRHHNRSAPENVFLGSTTVLVKNSSFDKGKHPDNPFSEFIVENGYNCTFFGGCNSALPVDMSQ